MRWRRRKPVTMDDLGEATEVQKGDPAYDFLMGVMDNGNGSAVRNEDGSWDVRFEDPVTYRETQFDD